MSKDINTFERNVSDAIIGVVLGHVISKVKERKIYREL